MRLILYSKPGCHLCEGLQEKLEQIIETRNSASLQLEIRDITSREDWLQAYQYEVPVLFVDAMGKELLLPRPSPRATLKQLAQMLEKYKWEKTASKIMNAQYPMLNSWFIIHSSAP